MATALERRVIEVLVKRTVEVAHPERERERVVRENEQTRRLGEGRSAYQKMKGSRCGLIRHSHRPQIPWISLRSVIFACAKG